MLVWLIRFVQNKSIDSLFYSLFLFPPAIIVLRWPIEFSAKRWIALALLLVVFHKNRFSQVRSFPIKWAIILMFLESCILILPDGRFDMMHRLLYPLMDALDIYLPLLLGFAFVFICKNRYNSLLRPITICCLIVEIYGIFNLITGLNPVEIIINNVYSLRGFFYTGNEERAITKSLYRYSFDFGYNSALFALLFIFFYFTQKKYFSSIHWIALGLSLLGIFICGSRTVIVAFAASISIFIFFLKSGKTKYTIIASGIILLVGLFLFVPAVTNIITVTINSILGRGDITGSSTDMRLDQLSGSLYYMLKNPIWGNGFKYIYIDLDWQNHTKIDGMAGYESLLFVLMIERGLIGIITYGIFFVSIIFYFLKYCFKHIMEAVLGLSIIVLFLFFSLLTGALDAWLNTMVLCGYLIANIVELKKKAMKTLTVDRM